MIFTAEIAEVGTVKLSNISFRRNISGDSTLTVVTPDSSIDTDFVGSDLTISVDGVQWISLPIKRFRIDTGPSNRKITIEAKGDEGLSGGTVHDPESVAYTSVKLDGKRLYRIVEWVDIVPGDRIENELDEFDIGSVSYNINPDSIQIECTEGEDSETENDVIAPGDIFANRYPYGEAGQNSRDFQITEDGSTANFRVSQFGAAYGNWQGDIIDDIGTTLYTRDINDGADWVFDLDAGTFTITLLVKAHNGGGMISYTCEFVSIE